MHDTQAGTVEVRRQDGIAILTLTGGDYQGAGSSSAGRLEFARAHNDLAQATSRLGKPLVAAINAHAGGFSLIALCDLTVCAEDATLDLPEAAHGLFPLLALAIVKNSFLLITQ